MDNLLTGAVDRLANHFFHTCITGYTIDELAIVEAEAVLFTDKNTPMFYAVWVSCDSDGKISLRGTLHKNCGEPLDAKIEGSYDTELQRWSFDFK